MESFWKMLGVQGTLFVYMAVGYALRRLRMISDEARRGISDLLLYVLLPCMIFASFQNGLTPEKLLAGARMLGVSCLICLIAWALGKLLWRRYPPERAALLVSGVRLLLMPAIVIVLMKPLGFPSQHIAIAAVLTGMPIGSTTAILAQKYGADARFGSQCVFVSTIGSLFTVPLLTLLV